MPSPIRGSLRASSLRISLLAAVLTPFVLGVLVAIRDPFGEMETRTLISLWVEVEVLVLVVVAVLAGHARARSERQRAAAIREVRWRAARDPLTSLLNRRGLVSMLSRRTWEGGDRRCSALLFDLDDFKQVNDRYGHITGDRVLVTAADALMGLTSRGWMVARLGGDEFLLVRSGTDLSEGEAREIAEMIPAALRRAGLPEVSASFGRAIDESGGEPLDWLLARADRDLNRARGRPYDPEAAIRFLSDPDEDSGGLLARGQELAVSTGWLGRETGSRTTLLRRVGLICASVALAFSLAAVASIPLGLVWLRTADVQGAMAFTTAATLALSALTLLIYFHRFPVARRRLRFCRGAGWLIAAIGVGAMLEHLTGRTLLVTELVSDPLEGVVPHINRPDFETGFGFLLGGLYTTQLQRKGRVVEALRALISLTLIAVIAAAAYGIVLDAGYLWQAGNVTISPHGMVTSALLASALLVAEPQQIILRPFFAGGGAARIAHTLAFAGVAMPPIAGAILVNLDLSEGLGWETTVMAVALAQAAIMGTIALVSLRVINEADRATAEVWRELNEVADRDPLTGLFNRGRFSREIELSRRDLKRNGRPYSVVLFDLDRLKELNTIRGYMEGDRALREVATALESGVRPSDLPVRLGGDEFGILLPGAGESDAEAIAARCARRIGDIEELTLNASWGIATDQGEFTSASEVIEAADRRLYKAKSRRAVGQAAQ